MNNRFLIAQFLFVFLFGNFHCFTTSVMAQEKKFSGFLPDGHSYVDVMVSDGLIHQIIASKPESAGEKKVFISAGLIDTQVNGYASISFNSGGLTRAKIEELTRALWKEGVTTFFPTLITNSSDQILKNLKVLSEAYQDPQLGHTMPGYFLEGPYISPLDGFRGAHQKEWVRLPDWNEFVSFYQAAEGRIIQVGLAPEIAGAMDFIKKSYEKGIVVSLAHHNASASIIEEAVNLGARVSTHLGNGCANMIHRHENPLWPQLAENRLTPSIIADGHHLRKEELIVFYKIKGPRNLMLVSDATELAGMPPGIYQWNGKEVVMTDDGMLMYPEQNVLAGASFPIRTGVKNMIKLTDCSLEEALQMASETPARIYSLEDRGKLAKGFYADLILFEIEDDELIIQKTILQGEVVYEKTNK